MPSESSMSIIEWIEKMEEAKQSQSSLKCRARMLQKLLRVRSQGCPSNS